MYSVFTKSFPGLLLALLVTGCGSMQVPFVGGEDRPSDAPTIEVPGEAQRVEGTELVENASQRATLPVAEPAPIPRLKAGNKELFERSLALLEEGRDDAAEVLLEELTQSQPELAGPWINLGIISLNQDDLVAAKVNFENAVAANVRNCDAQNLLGITHRRLGEFSEAEAAYIACLSHDPTQAQVQLNLGILYELYMGRLSDALVAYGVYQTLLTEPNQQVAGWVADLERRVDQIARR
ncbi:MAG: hypothetical protein AAF541_14910 [Pseudomonadota bacterium]